MVIMIALVQLRKIDINLSKSKTRFCLSLHYSGDEIYFYLNEIEISEAKVNDNIS